ncbi:MAG TPA: hypothetical protein VFI47_15815, partial [Acidimicrobiales bacterium]|nr:hypothetical protein [Acidimicrobiales bacterium]
GGVPLPPAGGTRWPDPTGTPRGTLDDPDRAPAESPVRQVFIPAPEELGDLDPDLFPDPPPVPPGPELPPGPGVRPGPAGGPGRRPPARPRPRTVDRRRLAVVYDIDGPRVRLGIAWFVGALVATAVAPATAALVYAAAAGLAARQVVKAWGSVSWQADLAAGLAAVPVLAALAGTTVAVGALVVALCVAAGAALAPDGARLPGSEGRLAATGILVLAVVPAIAGGGLVLVRNHSVVAAVVLVVVASAYEMGDYIVGSGASNTVEGPLAGDTTATLVALPVALMLMEPYDVAGPVLLALTAVACPLGQIVASAILPGAGAHAPALRRIDTLLVLAPLWVAASGAL